MLAHLLKMIERFRKAVENRVENFGAQYTAFAIFGILNYPIFYIIWIYYRKESYESLLLRLIATALCILLLFRKYWPAKLKPWLAVYWYITLSYCLPFFFFFMLLKNNGAGIWLMSSNVIIFWLLLMVDWVSYIAIFSLGVSAAILLYFFTVGFKINLYAWWGILAQLFACIIVVTFFAQNKFRFDQEKISIMHWLSNIIAHELRTPLTAINISATAIKNYLPELVTAYQKAKEHNLSIPHIHHSQLTALTESPNHIETETKSANTFITMLLTKAAYSSKTVLIDQDICSISNCVTKALTRYPFHPSQRNLINWQSQSDFQFKGNEILITHVLFNLIKNSLHYIATADKGKITIRSEHGKKYNKLYFHDTGTGIARKDLPQIFNRFYSKTTYGTGIGLAFCKMVMQLINGDITVSSMEGEYTEFVLYFPKK